MEGLFGKGSSSFHLEELGATKEERVETPRFPASKEGKRGTTSLQEVCQRTTKRIIDEAAL